MPKKKTAKTRRPSKSAEERLDEATALFAQKVRPLFDREPRGSLVESRVRKFLEELREVL